jgi:UDPglucose 6-dehydrogenase
MEISVIGMGYAGAVTAACLSELGHHVVGYDIENDRINSLASKKSDVYEPRLDDLISKNVDLGRLHFKHITESNTTLGEVAIITVGTPSDSSGLPNMEYIWKSVEWATNNLQSDSILMMRSTVQPGTGNTISKQFCEPKQINYVSCPEFLREGTAVENFFHPDRIIIGSNHADSIKKIADLHADISAPIIKTKPIAAEMIKFASNAFLATKISFINEMANFCEAWGIEIDDVKEGLGLDPRIGRRFLNAGVGFGGSCLPKETKAFTALASKHGIESNLLEAVLQVNYRQTQLPIKILGEIFPDLSRVKVAILGLTFKPDTDDVRESPAITTAKTLSSLGCEVTCFDPVGNDNSEAILKKSVRFSTSTEESVLECQAVLFMTPWESIKNSDWAHLFSKMKEPAVLFDGRNALDPSIMKQIGFTYIGVGRGISSHNISDITL